MTDKEKIKLLEKQIELLEKVIELKKLAQPISYPVYIPCYEPSTIEPCVSYPSTITQGTAVYEAWGGSDCDYTTVKPTDIISYTH